MGDPIYPPYSFSLYNYDCSEMGAFLQTNFEDICQEHEKWKNVIHNHIESVLLSPKSVKLRNLGRGLDWINSSKPLSLNGELINKILVLDFFTYCCINCEHALVYLQQVEEEFKESPELVVIGVHSPKFPNEKALDNVKNAVLRNNIKHPVINDPENSLYNTYGIFCWPTVLITSPEHHILFLLEGESQINKLGYICQQILNYFKEKNISLNTSPFLPMNSEEYKAMNSLFYPSGISTCCSSIIISDTGHNRLLLLSFDGKVLDIIGSGLTGHKDGSFADSSFNHPHGSVWWKSNFVFVADTGNHSIRMIDIKAKKVYTVFNEENIFLDNEGNSNKAKKVYSVFDERKPAVYIRFASPWDVCLGPELGSDGNKLNVLYIALAGSHQIWAALLNDLLDNKQQGNLKCCVFAGSGAEVCRNNTYKEKAGFAQPSGICCSELYPRTLYIADSESSSIRSIALNNGHVKTVVGGGLNPDDLFQFGDKDGLYRAVRLQHPLGICITKDEKIVFTDSYNHKIKFTNAVNQECFTLAGSGIKGSKISDSLLECEFDEPSAICYSIDKNLLLIADTNNHSIKMIDLETQTLKTMPVTFPSFSCTDAPAPSKYEQFPCQDPNYRKIKLSHGGKIKCSFKLAQPGISLTDGVSQPWNITLKGSCDWNVASQSNTLFDSTSQPSLILTCVDKNTTVHSSEIVISANLSVCDDVNKLCLLKKVVTKLQVEISDVGSEVYDGVFIFN